MADTQAIEVSDFSPGIFSSWVSGGKEQSSPDGAAQIDGTYGCIGSPTGGLMPGPRIVKSWQQPLFDNTAIASWPTGEKRAAIVAFRNLSSMRALAFNTSTLPAMAQANFGYSNATPDQLFVTFSHYVDTAGGTNFKSNVRVMAYSVFVEPAHSTMLYSDEQGSNLDVPYQYASANFALGRSSYDGNAANPGEIKMAFLIRHALAITISPGSSGVWIYPDLSRNNINFCTDSTYFCASVGVSSAPTVFDMLAHQGRLVFAGPTAASTSPTILTGFLGSQDSPERLFWTPANDWFSTAAPLGGVFAEESPSGIGAWATMNASEMVVIKRGGGGYALRGDINNPQIVRLPSMQPTYQGWNVPVASPFGLVYGSAAGVFLWTGGDTSQCISPQLDGWFWKPHSIVDQFSTAKGSFSYLHPFVFAPNNYIFDTRTSGWWRFGNPAKRTYAWNSPSSNGNMLCGPAYIDQIQQTVCDWYSMVLGAPYWTWTSQPFQRTRGRYVIAKELIIVAQGIGRISFVLQGIDEESAPVEFLIDDERPKVYRLPVKVTSHDIVAKIQSWATDMENDPAPTLNRFTITYDEGATITGAPIA